MKTKIRTIVICMCFVLSIGQVIHPYGRFSLSYAKKATKKLTISKKKMTLKAGATKKLTVKTKKKVNWVSDNQNVASVSLNGVVRAEGEGVTYIRATSGKKKAACKVTVCDPAVKALKNVEKEVKKRRKEILDDKTQVDVSGTKYYVSSSTGDDANDGLSPASPWKTVDKVNSTDLIKPGDGVYFKRGDIWRGMIIKATVDNITFSAYGEGEKPRFYGSPENGANPSNWTLKPGTDNIWVYHKEMGCVSMAVLNDGKQIAVKSKVFWDNGKYYKEGTNTPFDINELEDIQIFPDIDYTPRLNDPRFRSPQGYLIALDVLETVNSHYQTVNSLKGKLYMRCDKGNPGKVFDSIEFSVGIGMMFGSGDVVNNLAVFYVGDNGMTGKGWGEGTEGIHVQNCEIAFFGDNYDWFIPEVQSGVDGGEGIMLQNKGSAYNNYIHDSQEGVLTVETGGGGLDSSDGKFTGIRVNHNLFVNNSGGMKAFNFLEKDTGLDFSDILFNDNISYKTGYNNYFFDCTEIDGGSVSIGFFSDRDRVKNIRFTNNTFALSFPNFIHFRRDKPAGITFENNTYIQLSNLDILALSNTEEFGDELIYTVENKSKWKDAFDYIGDTSDKFYVYNKNRATLEMDIAKECGLITRKVKNFNNTVNEKEWRKIVERLINAIDPSINKQWEEKLSENPQPSKITLEGAAFYLFKLLDIVDSHKWNQPYWIILYLGDMYGYDHLKDKPLTYEFAAKLVVRFYNQYVDLNNFRAYLR